VQVVSRVLAVSSRPRTRAALIAIALTAACGTPSTIERREALPLETVPSIDLRLILPAQDAASAPRYISTATRAFRRFGEWLAPFPSPQVAIVGGSSIERGVEAPADAIVVRTPWLTAARAGSLELALTHAIAQRFLRTPSPPGDRRLADALALYITIKALDELGQDEKYPGGHAFEQRYFGGHVPWVFFGVTVNGSGWLTRLEVPPDVRRAVRALFTLERVVGWGTIQQAMTVFFARSKDGPTDITTFQSTVEQVSGRNLRWLFDEAFQSTHSYDYGVDSLQSTPDSGDASRFHTVVVVRRYGDAVFAGTSRAPRPTFRSSGPLEIVVSFEDGSEMREHWDGRDESMQLEYESKSRAVAAAIDPDQMLQLDDDRGNNRRTMTAPRRAAGIWALRWAVWLQDAMLTYAGFF
jgi:hypothetical protein